MSDAPTPRSPRPRRVLAAVITAAALAPALAGCLAEPGFSSSSSSSSASTSSPARSAAAVTAAQAGVSPSGAAAGIPRANGWSLRADAEFNTGRLGPALWSIGEPWNAAPGFSQSEDAWCPLPQTGQVTVSGGALRLNAIKKASNGKSVQSCFVTTRNKFSFTRGYVEARVKLPASPGLWPAFWLLGNGTGAEGWPKTGEIDMFEFVNNGRDNGRPFVTVHWGGSCPGGHCSYAVNNPYPAKITDYAGKWITYGMRRTADTLTIFVNGTQTVQLRRSDRNEQGQQLGSVLFDAPMHIRLDLSAGGWGQDPNAATQGGTFAIDYVRVWS